MRRLLRRLARLEAENAVSRSKEEIRLVYTSDPEEAKRLRENSPASRVRDLPHDQQTLRVTLDRKRGKGRAVTVAKGFQLSPASIEKLATELKKRCGAGGSASGDEIVIQGEKAEAVTAFLESRGFRVKK